MSKLFNALVIDDDPNRNETYLATLSMKFNTKIINDVAVLTKEILRNTDLFIIDAFLSKYNKDLTALNLMRNYNINKPVVIVSGYWLDENGDPNDFILNIPSFKNIIKLINWNSFNSDNGNMALAEGIYNSFCMFNNFVMPKINDRDTVTILHISDTQFGGKMASTAINDENRIASYLTQQQIKPDIIVISGDIANSGAKKEYDEALVWIETLCKELWQEDKAKPISQDIRNRIIIVEGNHDYNLEVCAADNFDFVFKSNDEKFKKNYKLSRPNQRLGFYNFCQFAFKLTQNIEWIKEPSKLLREVTHFENCGFRIYTLNSVLDINESSCEDFYSILTGIKGEQLLAKNRNKDEMINIWVTHNTPDDFGHGNNGSKEDNWNIARTFIEDNHINVGLFGHSHKMINTKKLQDEGGKFCENLVCVYAPTVRLNAASRSEDNPRGFNIIELARADGTINKIVVRKFKKGISVDYEEEKSWAKEFLFDCL